MDLDDGWLLVVRLIVEESGNRLDGGAHMDFSFGL